MAVMSDVPYGSGYMLSGCTQDTSHIMTFCRSGYFPLGLKAGILTRPTAPVWNRSLRDESAQRSLVCW
ncbi:MAG: hypothetical protein JWM11_3799 [Planctomycetaceae bacterium]|nr:hypothetical protein [Planctomycetaceae bacterium]